MEVAPSHGGRENRSDPRVRRASRVERGGASGTLATPRQPALAPRRAGDENWTHAAGQLRTDPIWYHLGSDTFAQDTQENQLGGRDAGAAAGRNCRGTGVPFSSSCCLALARSCHRFAA